ncbi:T9SS type A sorting domain-containing protein [Aquimarina hainanensis]|uniref:T9SS type A sorting domain-containing protein n=1 Tax=Aquimarina hainanensis TaxID=1578017 RepID=A0ABW5N6J9_9FLAO
MHKSFINLKSCIYLALLMCWQYSLHAQKQPAQKLYDSQLQSKKAKESHRRDNAIQRMEFEYERLKNPLTNKIPSSIRSKELSFSSKIPSGTDIQKMMSSSKTKNGHYYYWKNRGPYNVGGRTRALAIDRTDENIILAGGVSGGLWRSVDSGKNWKKVTRMDQSPSITCITQDPRPGKEHIWYYASGEALGNSARKVGAFYEGDGVYKSTNGGKSWSLLPATYDNDITPGTSLFEISFSIIVSPVNGYLYVATAKGILRSKDEGKTFEEILPIDQNGQTDITVSTTGLLYASTSSGNGENSGFFSSDDHGDTWTNITPEGFPATYGRSVIAIAPSLESTVYFLSFANQNKPPYIQAALYKYLADKKKWIDYTQNLPTNGGFGRLELFGGYNMVLKIHPTNPELIFLGGTDLYRSTDGFATPITDKDWIGGYSPILDPDDPTSSYIYKNQHPDQHALVFYPSNPNKVLSGNDGGVQITQDITATHQGFPVTWTSLNNGYITTQPYFISINHQSKTDHIIAGFQDNGTWYTNTNTPKTDWEEIFGGDGMDNAFADNGKTKYMSVQRGGVYRKTYNDTGKQTSETNVKPSFAAPFSGLFHTKFALDPNNDNIMYLPVNNMMWRNNNLDKIPPTDYANRNGTPINWSPMKQTKLPQNELISALSVSTYPIANRLYYGTIHGNIYRIDNANLDTYQVVSVGGTDKELPTGFINHIAVDPSNADRVIAVFSNYGIPSVFLSDDAGDSWTDISGNLEEHPDGSGNGPSVRAAAFFGSSEQSFGQYFQKIIVATSTGLYYSTYINGKNTRWFKESFRIGNNIAEDIEVRKDGLIALAVHGNGVYSAKLPMIFPFPTPSLKVNKFLENQVVNGIEDGTIEIDIQDVFKHSQQKPISIKVNNSHPEIVKTKLVDNTLTITYTKDTFGKSSIELHASSEKEKTTTGFTVNVIPSGIYEQIDAPTFIISSNFHTDTNTYTQCADDLIVPEGSSWNIEKVVAHGFGTAIEASKVTFVIYEDNNGVPGKEVIKQDLTDSSFTTEESNIHINFSEPITLSSGHYWISVQPHLNFYPYYLEWNWTTQEGSIGHESNFRSNIDLYGSGIFQEWTPASIVLGQQPQDHIFQLFGSVEGDIPNKEKHPLTTLNSQYVWPNPSSSQFVIDVQGLRKQKRATKASIQIFNSSGNEIATYKDVYLKERWTWDASNVAPGIYIIQISGNTFQERFKIIKR